MNPTRRAFLSFPLAAAMPPAASTPPAVSPELVKLARVYAAAADHVLSIQAAYDRVCQAGDEPAFQRFTRYILDPATETMDRAGMALAKAIDCHRLDGVVIDGRLYLGNLLELWKDCDHFHHYCEIVRVDRIAGLDATTTRSIDR